MTLEEAIQGLKNGDFTRLDPEIGQIATWAEHGDLPEDALHEALSCATFNGRISEAKRLLAAGAIPALGKGTGLDALHWASNRGQVDAVKLLLEHGADTETVNHYGGTALGTTIWSIFNEPGADRLPVVRALLEAGADVHSSHYKEMGFPTENEELNSLLRQYGATD